MDAASKRKIGLFLFRAVVIVAAFASTIRLLSDDPVAPGPGGLLLFTGALFCLGATREILGSGALFGYGLFGEHFEPWVIMILPPGGFLMLGVILLFFGWLREMRLRRRRATAEEVAP